MPAWRMDDQISPQICPVRIAVRRTVVVKLDAKGGEVADVRLPHVGDQLFFGPSLLTGPDHDRRAVRVIGADVDALVAAQLLESHPDIGLDVLDQVTDVDVAVRVGQSSSDEDAAVRHRDQVS